MFRRNTPDDHRIVETGHGKYYVQWRRYFNWHTVKRGYIFGEPSTEYFNTERQAEEKVKSLIAQDKTRIGKRQIRSIRRVPPFKYIKD